MATETTRLCAKRKAHGYLVEILSSSLLRMRITDSQHNYHSSDLIPEVSREWTYVKRNDVNSHMWENTYQDCYTR